MILGLINIILRTSTRLFLHFQTVQPADAKAVVSCGVAWESPVHNGRVPQEKRKAVISLLAPVGFHINKAGEKVRY
jgi:hypothetical protein